jgi:hypothetical protein
MHTGLALRLSSPPVGPLYRAAVEVRPHPHRGPRSAALHATNVYRALAKWTHDGALAQVFVASVAPLAAEKHLARSILGRLQGTTKAHPPRAQALRARGCTVPEIATALGVSPRTVFRYLATVPG